MGKKGGEEGDTRWREEGRAEDKEVGEESRKTRNEKKRMWKKSEIREEKVTCKEFQRESN